MSVLRRLNNSRNDLGQKIKTMFDAISKTTSFKRTLCMVKSLTRSSKYAKTLMIAAFHNITLWSPQSLKPSTPAKKWKRSFSNTRLNPFYSLNSNSNTYSRNRRKIHDKELLIVCQVRNVIRKNIIFT